MVKKLKKVANNKKDVEIDKKEEIVEESTEEEVKKEKKNTNNKKCKLNKKVCYLIGGILFVILCIVVGIIIYKKGIHEYPIIYKGKDNHLYLLKDGDKPEEAVSFSNRDGIGYISFFNDNPRYFLYKKTVDLYIYDVKKLTDKKIISNYSASVITNDDKYVIAIDEDGIIYSYKINGDINIIGYNVINDVAYTNDYILYEDDEDRLMLSYLNGKKREIIIDEKVYAYQFSDDGSNIVYINEDHDLIIYNIKKEKSDTINSKVEYFYCDSDECDDMYYTIKDGDERSILYYNGKKSSVYVKDAYDLEAVDVDANILLFSLEDEDNITLYIKDGKDEPIEIDSDYGAYGFARVHDAKYVYYVNSAQILKGYDIDKDKKTTLLENVSSSFVSAKDGYYLFNDVDITGVGVLYYLKDNKVEKVKDDVYSFNYYFVNKKGDKFYYLANYGEKSASLYVYDGKESNLIAEKVYQYQYINDNEIYYLRDYDLKNYCGKLYRYEGKKKTLIAEEVQSLVQTRVNGFRN